MTKRAVVDEFISQKKLALVRTSRKAPIAGFRIDTELVARNYSVTVVYLDEESSGTKLNDLKESVGGVIVAVPAEQAEKAVLQAIEAKISRVWIQQGSESQAALQLCKEKGISVIHGECVMMFAEPVKSFHAFHRWIWRMLGKLPN